MRVPENKAILQWCGLCNIHIAPTKAQSIYCLLICVILHLHACMLDIVGQAEQVHTNTNWQQLIKLHMQFSLFLSLACWTIIVYTFLYSKSAMSICTESMYAWLLPYLSCWQWKKGGQYILMFNERAWNVEIELLLLLSATHIFHLQCFSFGKQSFS